MNYYPFHIGDYISHTSHLTDEEDLAYRRMIDLYYMTEEPFTDVVWVARKVKSTPVIVETLLKEFFEYWMEDCTWRNKRADEEIAKYRLKADSARNANRIKSAKITALKSELKSEPNHIVTNNQEPITSIGVAKATKGTRFTLDAIPEEWILFCKKERSDLNPSVVFDGFKDYWVSVAGAKGVKLDWSATWRNWVRNQKQGVVKVSVNNFDEMMRKAK